MSAGLIKSKALLHGFIDKILNGNLENLKNFSFLNLNSDIKYHKIIISELDIKTYGGYFHKNNGDFTLHQNHNDYDDMNIIRAIYYLLFGYNKKLPKIVWEDFDWEYNVVKPDYNNYVYRGETINTFNTLIDENNYMEFFKDIKNSDEFIKKIEKFLYKVFSIGNFMILPNKKYGSETLNIYKGSFLGDYSDLFLNHIINSDNDFINALKKENEFYFDMDIEEFIEINYLQDYFTNEKVNYSFSPHYKYWYYNKMTNINEKEIIADFIRNYIDIVTEKINLRAERMIKDLAKIIC